MNRLRLACLAFLVANAPVFAGDVQFKKHDINPKSVFEAAGAFDVDKDGKLDIVSGEMWYKGPDFKQSYKVRDVSTTGTYRNCFSTIPMDVNADGKMDFITCSYFERSVGWVENPGEAGKLWTYHAIDTPGSIEAAVAVDLNGDGKLDFLPNTTNVICYYSLEKAGAEPKWKKTDLGAAAAGHGVGSGDVNGDGKLDILTPKGWYEATGDSSPGGWTWHGDWNLGATGIQILAKDVDGDGLSDIIWGMGHNRHLKWMKQEKAKDGMRAFSKEMMIDPTLSSVHTLLWADLDGDGKKDELITGKRVYAHETEPGDIEASQVAYYTYDKGSNGWVKHSIYTSEPATNAPKTGRDAQKDFPAGTAGTGLEIAAIDIDGDGDIDLVCPGKSGLYLFENLGKKP